jgi:hypothetical protein
MQLLDTLEHLHPRGGLDMSFPKDDESKMLYDLMRLRRMEAEVNDPIAMCLLHDLVADLEVELDRGSSSSPEHPPMSSRDNPVW